MTFKTYSHNIKKKLASGFWKNLTLLHLPYENF